MEKALFIENDVRLFGFLFLPEPAVSRPIGFVAIHPFAEEKKSAHRTLVELSRELCRKGFPVLMFDLRGCGDSEGSFASVRLSDWLNDITVAVQVLKTHTQIKETGMIGLRFGAYLSLCCACRGITISEYIWIEPVVDAVEYLRKTLRRKLMKELCTGGAIVTDRNGLFLDLQNNISIDFDGYEIGSDLYSDLVQEERKRTFAEKLGNIRVGVIISVSVNGKRSKEVERIAGLKTDLEYAMVRMDLFWNKIEEVNNDDLILKITEYVMARYSAEKYIMKKVSKSFYKE